VDKDERLYVIVHTKMDGQVTLSGIWYTKMEAQAQIDYDGQDSPHCVGHKVREINIDPASPWGK
jgi:hypothetical protein